MFSLLLMLSVLWRHDGNWRQSTTICPDASIEEEDDVISHLKQAKWNRFIDPITVNNYALQ